MTSGLLTEWGIRPGMERGERLKYITENRDRFTILDGFPQLYDLLRDKAFSQMATLASIEQIEYICGMSAVSLSELFISNDYELNKIDGWTDEFSVIITNASKRFRDLSRDSS